MTHLRERTFRAFGRKDIGKIQQFENLPADQLKAIKAVSAVLPFRVNNYVLEELIDWNDLDQDPIFQLTIPQPGMLADADLDQLTSMMDRGCDDKEIMQEARKIQMSLNPHPAGQMELNVPVEDGEIVSGVQHKYRETVLFFPSQGQTCHSYCTYCFRWAQFVGIDDLKFAGREADQLVAYLKSHPEVTDVLFTGGDPMIMKTRLLRRYIEPLLQPGLEHIRNIRIGTKAPAYWPYRFTTDRDADDLMALFEEVVAAGKHLAVMAHYSHPRELSTPASEEAVKRILSTGAVVRCQAPLIRHVNDNAEAWATMWQKQVSLGAIPYYFFVERDTGPKEYFKVPLERAYNIFSDAYTRLSGLGRTVRGPSMSATPGKVMVDGITEIAGEKLFALKFIQARDPQWVNKIFFAKFDRNAAWLDELKPAFGEDQFFFEEALAEMQAAKRRLSERRQSAIVNQLDLADLPN